MNIRFKKTVLFTGFLLFLLFFGGYFSVYAQNNSLENCPPGSCIDNCKNLYVPSLTNGMYKSWCVTKEEQGGAGGRWEGCLCKAPIKDKIQLNVPIPGLGKGGGTGEYLVGGLASYIQHIFIFFIGASIIVSLCVIIISGVRWIASGGNSSTISKSKERIKGAIIGVLIGIFSYSILYFINPDLVQLELREIYTFPAVVENGGSCSKFKNPPFNSKNLLAVAKKNAGGWLCGETKLTVKEFNNANVLDANGQPIFLSGDLDAKACDGFYCQEEGKGCDIKNKKCADVNEMALACVKSEPEDKDSWWWDAPVNEKEEYCNEYTLITPIDNKGFKCVYSDDRGEVCIYVTFGYTQSELFKAIPKQLAVTDANPDPCLTLMKGFKVKRKSDISINYWDCKDDIKENEKRCLYSVLKYKNGKKVEPSVYNIIADACNNVVGKKTGSPDIRCEMKEVKKTSDTRVFGCKMKE